MTVLVNEETLEFQAYRSASRLEGGRQFAVPRTRVLAARRT